MKRTMGLSVGLTVTLVDIDAAAAKAGAMHFRTDDVAIQRVAGSYAMRRYEAGGWVMGSVTGEETVKTFLAENGLVKVYSLSDDQTEGIYRPAR